MVTSNLNQKRQETQTAYITSAVKLTEEEEKKLATSLKVLFGKNFIFERKDTEPTPTLRRGGEDVIIEEVIQPSVLGGLKIKIGSQIIDSTLHGQLEKIKDNLKKIIR